MPNFESDYDCVAIALYGNGWRSRDRDRMKNELGLRDETIDEIVRFMAIFEALGDE